MQSSHNSVWSKATRSRWHADKQTVSILCLLVVLNVPMCSSKEAYIVFCEILIYVCCQTINACSISSFVILLFCFRVTYQNMSATSINSRYLIYVYDSLYGIVVLGCKICEACMCSPLHFSSTTKYIVFINIILTGVYFNQ